MTKANQRRFVLYLTLFGAVLAIAYFLWYEDFLSFWSVLLGAAYLLFDKWFEDEKKHD